MSPTRSTIALLSLGTTDWCKDSTQPLKPLYNSRGGGTLADNEILNRPIPEVCLAHQFCYLPISNGALWKKKLFYYWHPWTPTWVLHVSCGSTGPWLPGHTYPFSSHLNVSFAAHCPNASLAWQNRNQKQLLMLPCSEETETWQEVGPGCITSRPTPEIHFLWQSSTYWNFQTIVTSWLPSVQAQEPMGGGGVLTVVLLAGNFIIPHIDCITHNRLSQIELLVSHMVLLLQTALSWGLTHFVIPKLFHWTESSSAWLIKNKSWLFTPCRQWGCVEIQGP